MKQTDPVAASVYTELVERIKQQDIKINALEVSLGQIMQLVARVESSVKRSDRIREAFNEDTRNAQKLQARVRAVSRKARPD
jgi:hypothetical protein